MSDEDRIIQRLSLEPDQVQISALPFGGKLLKCLGFHMSKVGSVISLTAKDLSKALEMASDT